MKKIYIALIASLSIVSGLYAQTITPEYEETRKVEHVNFALNGDKTIDIIGLRLNVAATCQNVTGVDVSVWGDSYNAYGLQLALLRNNVRDRAGALQIALLNNTASYLTGVQLALTNDTTVGKGVQLGIVNSSYDFRGLQLGLINCSNTLYGYQLGLINVIKSSTSHPFLPLLNIGGMED